MNIRNVWCSTRVLGAMAAALCAASFPASALTEGGAVDSSSNSVTAQWQDYDLDFHYFGFTSIYTCSGLEGKLEQLLQELGADKSVRVNASGCFGSNDLGKSISAHIKVRMPVVQATAGDASFKATSKAVKLRSGRSGDYNSTDCELLEQVRDQLLPAFKMKLLSDDLVCVPGQPSLGSRGIEVMALLPEAKPKAK